MRGADESGAWCTLDFGVDHSALLDDLGAIQSLEWRPQATASVDQRIQPRTSLDWSVVPLLSPRGDPVRTDPGLPGEDFGRTPMLDLLGGVDALLTALPCEKASARLLRLVPDAQIEPHVDSFFGLHYGKVRLHVPVVTSEAALMVFGDDSVHWSPGHLWYGDFSRLHTVTNAGPDDRIHLVVDCLVNTALLDLYPSTHRPAEVMINRVPQTPAPRPALSPGRWHLTMARRALDWSGGDDPTLDEDMVLDLVVGEAFEDVFLQMPSGFEARLRAVENSYFRVGRMPEETLVRLDRDSVTIIRSVGASHTAYPCILRPAPDVDLGDSP